MRKLFTFFAGLLVVSTLWADAVYEPLIVSSGFNRDVIAEDTAYYKYSVSYYQPYNTSKNAPYYKQHNHATKEVVRLTNDSNTSLTSAQKEYLATETGWPNDYGNPGDRIVNCLTDRYPDLYWELAPYTAENALCLRDSTEGCVNSGRLTFRNVGCYQKLYFLTFAGGVQDAKKEDETSVAKRTMTTTVYYSTGEPDTHPFEFLDCAGVKAERQAHRCQIYSNGFVKGTSSTNTVYAAVSEMNVDTHRLIDSVHFSYNGSKSTGIAIFAVTGLTANIAAPDANPAEPNRAPLRAKEITQNTVSVEWDPVDGAESYRIDVATDEDFHNMVEGFNNGAVITSPDTVITGLDADHEYYWRVRAVNSEGGQSASSAPRRVRTESSEGPKVTNDYDHSLKTNDITPLLNTTTNLTINRKLYKDGYYNTICLPFDQSASELAELTNPLHGFTIYEFDGATKIGDAQLDIRVKGTDHIQAGIPYLLEWPAKTDEVLNSLEFKGVTIIADEGQTIGGADEVQFVGNIATAPMTIDNHDNLFVGANNVLYWPNTSNGLKGFRAHFEVPASGTYSVPRNSPARIVVQSNVATGVENTSARNNRSEKKLENGQLVIINNSVRYNAQGQKIK